MFGDDDEDDYNGASPDDNDNDDYVATDSDGDRDSRDGGYFDADDAAVRGFGRAAGPNERGRIVALVRRYFAVADVENGAAACALIAPSLRGTIGGALSEAGPRYLKGAHGCTNVATRLFEQNHAQLSAYAARLHVSGVRLQGNLGLVVFDFRPLPGRQIEVIRERSAWRMYAPVPGELP